jgi:hypothetical protein
MAPFFLLVFSEEVEKAKITDLLILINDNKKV